MPQSGTGVMILVVGITLILTTLIFADTLLIVSQHFGEVKDDICSRSGRSVVWNLSMHKLWKRNYLRYGRAFPALR